MEEFKIKLLNVPDSYYGFMCGVLTYVNNKKSRLKVVGDYIDSHPEALTSDILEFISDQDDFFEDTIYEQA